MTRWAWLAAAGLLAACSSSKPSDTAELTINDPSWDRVNVQIVVTKSEDCDKRDAYISSREVVMRRNKLETVEVPSGASVCWRHDRDPTNPSPGSWTGWTRATLFPGQSTNTDL